MSRQNVRLLLLLLAVIVIVKALDRNDGGQSRQERRESRTAQDLDEQLAPPSAVEAKEGLAAAIVIDVSGSMKEQVEGRNGEREAKIEIARRAALDLVDQFTGYARDHQDEAVQLGLYEFSRRGGEPDCRPIVEMGPPDRERAASAIAKLEADGGTPIGGAMIPAKRALDATGLTRRHLLVVTDGENTDGVTPERVAAGINKRPDAERPAIYFVAFDVDASRFKGVRDAGGLVLSAANATELNNTLDALLRGKILVEK
ncbi:MAG TPA: VWA domain-containing protein [Vicinamibacterales bacterium]|nr:VWA domain-containing protein [Vicinamibacterales bacterium]